MAVRMRSHTAFTRRGLLKTVGTSAAITAIGGVARPSLSWAPDRPQITHGVQSGDVSVDAGVVWARADRSSRMLVEIATSNSFRDIKSTVFVDALPQSDFTAKVLIEDLPAGKDIFYRISFQDLSSAVFGEPQIGRFRTAPSQRRSISFLWSGDTMGQGWGIDKAHGGMRTYAIMRRNRPDFFIHCGDNIYADCPIAAEKKNFPTARFGAASSLRRSRSRPKRSLNIAEIINTICWTIISARSTPKCRHSRYGTTTKSWKRGGRVNRYRTSRPAKETHWHSLPAPAGPFTNSYQYARP